MNSISTGEWIPAYESGGAAYARLSDSDRSQRRPSMFEHNSRLFERIVA